MQPLSDHLDRELSWIQPKTSARAFELRVGDELLATLRFQSAFGSLAVADSSAGSWTFKRVGFFNPRVTVRVAGQEFDTAVYTPRWTGSDGKLAFANGRTYRWSVANFWSTKFQICDLDGEPLIGYHSGSEKPRLSDIFKTQAFVQVTPRGRELPDLPLLVLVGWYLIILQHEDSAAAAAVIAAT